MWLVSLPCCAVMIMYMEYKEVIKMLVPSRIRPVSILVESGQDQSGLVMSSLLQSRLVWSCRIQSCRIQ